MEKKQQDQALVSVGQQQTSLNLFNVEQFNMMQRVSMFFASSDLVPDMYRISENNPKEKAMANCMIALDMAQRIGANVLMVMQNLVIIYGRPSWSSKFLISTVNTCGRFEPLKFKFIVNGKVGKMTITEYEKVWEKSQSGKSYQKNVAVQKEFDGSKIDNIECIAYTTKKGSDEILESSPVSIKMAIEEGWYNKAGSKWKTMPKQMLMYRAASFWINVYAPELSMGMKTTEEVIDIEYTEVNPHTSTVESVQQEIENNANREELSFDNTTEEFEQEQEQEEIPQIKIEEQMPSPKPVQPMAPADDMPLFMQEEF